MLTRRTVIASMASIIAAPLFAQSGYPHKPLRLLVPFTPGGVSDGSARIVADGMREQLGQAVVVENRPGASGLISGELVARAEPDGHTVMLGYNGQMTINPFIVERMPYNTLADLVAVGKVGDYPSVLAANMQLPVENWNHVFALAANRPEGLSYGTSGTGGTEHLIGVLLAKQTGARLTHIPYKGAGPALADAVAGHIPLSLTSLSGALPFVKSGKLRPIAMSGEVRSPAAPDIPTFAEAGVPNLVLNSWVGIIAPGKTPKPILDRLNAALNAALKTEDVRTRLRKLGVEPRPGTPADFQAEIARDYARFRPVVSAAKIKLSE
jgi:tripartite-type tricarboxylate transporter receptor subunit TctC